MNVIKLMIDQKSILKSVSSHVTSEIILTSETFQIICFQLINM